MKVTKFFGLWILSVLCVLSCTDEEQGTGNIVPNVATAPVKLSLDATPMRGTVSTTRTRGDNSLDLVLGEEAGKTANTAGTRAGTLTDVQEDAINDICVFQFGNADGKLKYSEYASLTDGQLTANISLASGVGTCTVYVLANVGDLTQKVSYGSALADFKKFAAEVSSGKGTGQNLPMCGYKTDFNSETDNASLTVSLTRAVAKVSLNLTTPNTGDVFTVTSVRLMNVAKKLYYVESATTAPTVAELTTYTSDNTKSIAWYVPENKAGSNSLTDWKDRYEDNVPATATYILIEGSYTPKGGIARDVAYTIYLGAGDKAGDFNVVRNTKYTINAAIKGTNMNDGRVLVGKDLSAAGTQTANCYVVNTTDANKWYRFKATIRGNGAATSAQISYTGTDIPANDRIAPDNAALVWETREGDKAPTLDYVGYSRNGYIVFKLGEATEGNAVVAAKNGATTLWSWHIWITAAFDRNGIKVQTYETRPRNGLASYANITKREFKMMDRNLGAASGTATKVAEEAIKTYGVYFQFGRKDPFPAAGVMTRINDADIVPVYDANGNKITGINEGCNATFSDTADLYSKLKTRKTGNVSITAKWTPHNYTISYNLNGGTANNKTSYTIETEKFTLNAPTKKGYTFLGWTGSNGTTPQKTVSIAKGSTGNKSYTAIFEKTIYTITTSKVGSGALSDISKVEYDDGTSVFIIPAEGYTTSSLKIDGVSVSPVTKYNFLNVNKDHKVEATFTISQNRKMELMQKGYSWIDLKL